MESLLSLTQISRRRRNILLACCAFATGGYVSYRVYTSPSVTRKRRQLYKFFHSLSSLLESTAEGSDCVGVLWKDLHSFLLSSQDEVPQSLKQLFKVGQTREFQTSLALLCRSVTQGVASSLNGQGPVLQDGSDYCSALFEELSSQKEGVRKIGKAGRDLGYRDNRDGRHSWKDRRWRSSGEGDASQFKNATEVDYNYTRGKLERSESASRIDGEGDDRWSREEDEAGRYSAWKTSRSYYREKGSWAGAPVAEAGIDGGKGKIRSHGERKGRAEGGAEGLSERLVGKLFSEAGRGFASVVVASAARSLVLSVLEGMQEMRKGDSNSTVENICSSVDWELGAGKDPHKKGAEKDAFGDETLKRPTAPAPSGIFQGGMIDFICSSKGKSLIADCVETFIGTAVSVYLEKTRDVHICEDIISSVSKSAHREPVKDLLTSVCNGAVETLIRASHEVISVGSSSGLRRSEPESTEFEMDSFRDAERAVFSLGKSSCFDELGQAKLEDAGECGSSEGANERFRSGSPPPRTPDNHDAESPSISGLTNLRIAFDHSPPSEKKLPLIDLDKVEGIVLPPSSSRQINGKPVLYPTKSTEGSQGWIDGVSRTLAVPSNRALVLDVAGTVTAEAVRSAIEVVASKVSLTLRGKSKEKEPAPEGTPSTSKVLHVINKTGALAQATAAKAMVAMTMCLAICLHTLVGPSRGLQL